MRGQVRAGVDADLRGAAGREDPGHGARRGRRGRRRRHGAALRLHPGQGLGLQGAASSAHCAADSVDSDGELLQVVGDRLVQWRCAPSLYDDVVLCEWRNSGLMRGFVCCVAWQNVALNICDVIHFGGELIVATRDGRVFAYRAKLEHDDPDEVAQMEVNGEIETLLVLHSTLSNPDASPQLLARCFSGEVFCVRGPSAEETDDKREITPWNGPPHDTDGITFVVGDIELGGERGMVALVSMTGLVSLFSSSGERQWDFQQREEIAKMLYVKSEDHVLLAYTMGIRESSSTQIDPTIVSISTSGAFFVFRDVQETLIRGLRDSTLADKVRESAVFPMMETPEKRESIMKKLRDAFPEAVASTAATTPTMEELISAILAVPVQPAPTKQLLREVANIVEVEADVGRVGRVELPRCVEGPERDAVELEEGHRVLKQSPERPFRPQTASISQLQQV
ncbi:hypothetical protein ON010_g17124 [Phytophthora cinnamomi]|nr:hypothetical protein ON010_g17124 [Phytophthora cinnamomi]